MRALPALVLLLAAPLQELGPRPADALYPCQARPTVVRFFELENDEPDLAKLRAALAELGAELAYGPRTTSGRPGRAFLAVRAPRAAPPKKLAAAVKKGGGAAEELECLAFDGRTGEEHDFGLGGLGVTQRDFVMGLSGDVLWYEASGTWSQFFGPPGKLEARELAQRYEKLYAPYGGARLGAVVEERFTWTLASAPDEKARAKLLKKLERLPGVGAVRLEGTALGVVVRLAGLEASGDVGVIGAAKPLDEAGAATPRLAFDAGGLHELLVAEGLLP